jgi:hypothetical protein
LSHWKGTDAHDLMGVALGKPATHGKFDLPINDVRFD